MTNILDKIVAARSARQANDTRHYAALVEAVAAGREPDAAQADAILQASGKTTEDLASAVQAITTRAAMRSKVATIPKLNREAESNNAAIAAEERKFHAAQVAYQTAVTPLFDRRQTISSDIADAERARQTLADSCADEALLQQIAEASGRRNALYAERRAWAADAQKKRDAELELARAGLQLNSRMKNHLVEDAQRRVEACGNVTERLVEIDEEISKIEAQLAELEEKKLSV